MKLNQIAFATLLALGYSVANAAPATWIDWNSSSSNSASGTLKGSNVSLSASLSPGGSLQGLIEKDQLGVAPYAISMPGQSDFYNGTTGFGSSSGTFGGYIGSAINGIRLDNAGVLTLTFAHAVVNPYIALLSVGANDNINPLNNKTVSYTFSSAGSAVNPVMLSSGKNAYSTANSDGSLSGYTLSGTEYSGIVRLYGTYSSLTITVDKDESLSGFNVGVAAVPEPETYAMFLAGLGLVGAVARRRRAS